MNYEEILLNSILSVVWIEFFWELYLALRQHKVYSTSLKIPQELDGAISKETYEKSRLYGLDKSKFSIFKDCYSVLISTAVIWFFMTHYIWKLSGEILDRYTSDKNELLQSAVFIFLSNTITTIMHLPISVYYTFVLEEKHGFNKQTAGFFLKDKLKAFAVTQVLFIPLTCAAVYIVKVGGDFFFLYLWLFAVIMAFVFMTIYPDFIAPLFDKYTPLPEGELKKKIEELTSRIHFPLYKLYLVEGSKRSVHSNAYFYGFFKNKRIVLFDTLVKGYIKKEDGSEDEEEKGCDVDEVLAILSHELGHWNFNHIAKNIVIMQVNLLLQFAAFGFLFKYPLLYRSFGFLDEQPIIIGLNIVILYLFSPYNSILSFMLTVQSRQFEFQADRFAASLNKAEHLAKALIKLHKDNLSFPVYDWLYSTWHHSHPTLLQRLDALRKKQD